MEPMNWFHVPPTPQMMGAMVAQAKMVGSVGREIVAQAVDGKVGGFEVRYLAYVQYPVDQEFHCVLQLGSVPVLITRLVAIGSSVELSFQAYPNGRPAGWPDVDPIMSKISEAEVSAKVPPDPNAN